jgi:hypothetical protein
MSRRLKKPKPAPATPRQAAAAQLGLDVAAWSGFAGANTTRDRGWLLWPTLDTRMELDSFSREELMRRIRALKANVGFVKGIIENAAVLTGYQTIQANSGDEKWDRSEERRVGKECY